MKPCSVLNYTTHSEDAEGVET